MRNRLHPSLAPLSPAFESFTSRGKKEQFEERFRCKLACCVRRGFQVEECFGQIWEETLEDVELSSAEQNELFPEMIVWAKRWVIRPAHASAA